MVKENEKSRKHKMEITKLMFGQQHSPFQEPSSSITFHYHSPSSCGNSSLFQVIPYHQNHVAAERKRNHPKNQDSFYNILQTLPSPTYIKEIITGKQWMFYQSHLFQSTRKLQGKLTFDIYLKFMYFCKHTLNMFQTKII